MTARLRVYRHPISGHCHRVELLLGLLGLPHELTTVDLPAKAHQTPEFLQKNPLGQVPVLEHGDFTLADSNAIMIYLAEQFDQEARFYPRDARQRGQIQRWLSLAAGELMLGANRARLVKLLGKAFDYDAAAAMATRLLGLVNRELSERRFLVGDSVTLADCALYAYTALVPEGGVSLAEYPHVRAWHLRLESLPGFVPMQRAAQSGGAR